MRKVTSLTLLGFVLFMIALAYIHTYPEQFNSINMTNIYEHDVQGTGTEVYEFLPLAQFELVPDVCVMEPDDEEVRKVFHEMGYYKATVEATKYWEDSAIAMAAWFDTPKGIAWNYDLRYIPQVEHEDKTLNDYITCNIFVIFLGANPDGKALGVTSFDFADSRHKYAVIWVYTQAVPRTITFTLSEDPQDWTDQIGSSAFEPETLNYEAIRQIYAHEFGHSIGLGHYYPGLNNPSRSIMEISLNPFTDAGYVAPTPLDIFALITKYGPDGFLIWQHGDSDKYFISPPPKVGSR